MPAVDTDPPKATVEVHYTGTNGVGVQIHVNSTDRNAPTTVSVPRATPFTILYSGQDSGGVRTIALDWKYYRNNQLIQPLVSPDDYSSCAATLRAKAVEQPWRPQVQLYQFSALATDFRGHSAATPTLTIRHGANDWPLGAGPFKAGFRRVADVPISGDVSFTSATFGGVTFQRPNQNSAVIFYPATQDGEAAAVAGGGPFPLITVGHAKRFPFDPTCSGTPSDATQDYRQLDGQLAHLARWGFVTIAPDLFWLTTDASATDRRRVLRDAGSYMLRENVSPASPFLGKIKTVGHGVLGHSTGGLAAVELAAAGDLPLEAMALLAPAAGATDLAKIAPFAPKPVLNLHGTNDTGTRGVGTQPVDLFNTAGATKYLVTTTGANHFGYTDGLCLPTPADGPAGVTQADQQRIARAYLSAFFRRHLLADFEVDDYLAGGRLVEEIERLPVAVQAQR